jgi:LuxR family maltose regulon positive regulatory protein
MRNAACHVQLALAVNDLVTAQFWSEKVTEPTDTSLLYPCLGFTPVRILLARQDKTEALEELNKLYETTYQKDCGAGMVEVRALQALAADSPDAALHFLQDALKRAEPEGYLRTFVDKGEPMQALLNRLKSQKGALKGYIQTVLAAFGETSRATHKQLQVEPLSGREVEVLRLLGQGMSNGEIAKKINYQRGNRQNPCPHHY